MFPIREKLMSSADWFPSGNCNSILPVPEATEIYTKICTKESAPPPIGYVRGTATGVCEMMCDITKTDLTRFFAKWGYLQPFDQMVDDYGQKRLQVTQAQIDRIIAEIKAKDIPKSSLKLNIFVMQSGNILKTVHRCRQNSKQKWYFPDE